MSAYAIFAFEHTVFTSESIWTRLFYRDRHCYNYFIIFIKIARHGRHFARPRTVCKKI